MKQNSRRPTLILAASYLIVIMAMSITYSLILYSTSTHDLESRPDSTSLNLDQRDPDHEIDEWLGQREANHKSNLAARLLILNLSTIVGGSLLSYYLARRTLRPIERAMEDQYRFIADASHELRTPLTSILLSNEVALRKKHISEADARHIIAQNIDDIKELKALSDELLDLSVEDSRIHTTFCKLDNIIADAIHQVASLAATKQIMIQTKMNDLSLSTNKAKLTKAIVILLDNAIKYGASNESVHITVDSNDDGVTINVHNKGIGIAPSDLPHVFERFYRADQSRLASSGHGLGLSIAKKLIDQLNGRLTAKSMPDRETIFTIYLPR